MYVRTLLEKRFSTDGNIGTHSQSRIRDCGGIHSKWDTYITPYTKVQESYWRRRIVRTRG